MGASTAQDPPPPWQALSALPRGSLPIGLCTHRAPLPRGFSTYRACPHGANPHLEHVSRLGLPLQLLRAQPIGRRSHVQFRIVGAPKAAGSDPGHRQVQGAQTEACGQREDPGRPPCSRTAPGPSALPPHSHPVFIAPIHTQTCSQCGQTGACKQAAPAMLSPWHPDSPAAALPASPLYFTSLFIVPSPTPYPASIFTVPPHLHSSLPPLPHPLSSLPTHAAAHNLPQILKTGVSGRVRVEDLREKG